MRLWKVLGLAWPLFKAVELTGGKESEAGAALEVHYGVQETQSVKLLAYSHGE